MNETMTIKDIANICGVAVSTVSRAINNHSDINPQTKAMIMKVIMENNYIPNNSARNLKRSDSDTIAVLIKGISNPFFSAMIKTFEKEIKRKNYSFILQRVDDKEDEVDVAIELVKEKRLKGIVFLGGYFCHCDDKLRQLKVPFVLSTIAATQRCDESNFCSVAVDDILESYKIVDFLCKLGHKNIAIIKADNSDESIGKLRFDGYLKALEDNNISINPNLFRVMKEDLESYSMANGYAVTRQLLESQEDFTAIFAISDSLAIGACKAILDYGKGVPRDYSVVGFDGIEVASYYNPSITTIKQPVEAMAVATIRLLFDVIHSKIRSKHIIFPAQLIIGQSTRSI